MEENNIVVPEAPVPEEPQTHQEPLEGNESKVSPQTEDQPEEATVSVSPTEDADNAPYMTVKYNGERRGLTRDETEMYARHGLLYENKMMPLYNKLDYLAAQSDTTVEALVENMMTAAENSYREELVEKFGEDETVIEDLMRIYHEKQKAKYDKVLADRKTAEETQANDTRVKLETRLADEFIILKKEFPALTEFTALPEEVKRSAASGKSLAEAYLRYLHTEGAKIEANDNAAQKAAESTAGSLNTNQSDHENAVVDAFMRGFNS